MDRAEFLGHMLRMAGPVLDAAAKGNLRKSMSIEQKPGAARDSYAGLEAVARLLCGMSSWLDSDISDANERKLRDTYLQKARLAIEGQVNPSSEDFADYYKHGGPLSQFLVDAAFLAQAILRAPGALWDGLGNETQKQVIRLLEACRTFTPNCNNWLLFSAEIELLYLRLTGSCNTGMLKRYFGIFESWYVGDGWYSDGPFFTMDYYNSLVIHPMLLDLCDIVHDMLPPDAPQQALRRSQRHAEILERLVAPDGTFLPIGRSLTYRCGVFHLLALLAWQKRLPETLAPTRIRELLGTVAARTLGKASYREDGFLKIGVCDSQPGLGEGYICTGSLYMASAVFLPLGLVADDGFWKSPAAAGTQARIWSGADMPAETALEKRSYEKEVL
jgi:hypothetical protein